MQLDKKKIIILITAGVVITIASYVLLYFTGSFGSMTSSSSLSSSSSSSQSVTSNNSSTLSSISSIAKSSTSSSGRYSVNDNQNGTELTTSLANSTEQSARSCFEKGNLSAGIKQISALFPTTNFSKNGTVLKQLYYESSLIQDLQNTNSNGAENIFKSIKDSEMQLLACLHAPQSSRYLDIVNQQSIMPIFSSVPDITPEGEEKGTYLNEIKIENQSVTHVYKYSLTILTAKLMAYVMVTEEGVAKVYSFQVINNNTASIYASESSNTKNYTSSKTPVYVPVTVMQWSKMINSSES